MQVGRSAHHLRSGVSCLRWLPFASMTNTSSSLRVVYSPTSSFRVKAMCRPSGDHAGFVVGSFEVKRRLSAPSLRTVQIAHQGLCCSLQLYAISSPVAGGVVSSLVRAKRATPTPTSAAAQAARVANRVRCDGIETSRAIHDDASVSCERRNGRGRRSPRLPAPLGRSLRY